MLLHPGLMASLLDTLVENLGERFVDVLVTRDNQMHAHQE
jgi:hypothetical protein